MPPTERNLVGLISTKIFMIILQAFPCLLRKL